MAANKRAGKKSLAQNDSLFPAAPLIGTATDTGTNRPYNNGAASITFTAQGPNAATSYTVTSSPDGYTATGSSSPISVTGLQSATNYTFTVTATNAYGTSSASSASNSITATTVPDKPAAPSASSPNANEDVLSWTAPANGGSAISGYIWASNDGKTNATGGTPGGGAISGTSATISQEAGTAQTYTIYAINANGNSVTSDASNNITTTFSFAPFGAFGFSPFGFSPFGFSPFGFSPFRCIAENTEVATVVDGQIVMVKAKDLAVGNTVLSPTWSEFSNDDDPYNDRVEYSSLTNKDVVNGTIAKITTKPVDKTIIINNNPEKHYSLTQPVLARKENGLDAWEFTKDLEVGDFIWEYSFENEAFEEVEITELEVIDGDETVYALSIDGIHTFIAGGVVSHNKL
jgi:hypothetical protein